jgi:hypothetical protein
MALVVVSLSYATAYMETLTIAHVGDPPLQHGRSAVSQIRFWGCTEGVLAELFWAQALGPALFLMPQYPYYTFVDRNKMYTIGSLFYAIYFFVSFPMFYRMDEVCVHPMC